MVSLQGGFSGRRLMSQAQIIEPGHPTEAVGISYQRGHAMLKTISAALLAVSVLAAPAFATTTNHAAPVAGKHRVMNAHARIDHHFYHHRRHHHSMAAHGKHHISKAAIKHAAVKRG